ncbi:hypothetical protein [Magnetospirillum molischianum]|uniref:Cell division protein ftsZ n=1 Tax=Magnetospirillum molischianum DSM 120 TaxID=1150626 RepID=H8FMP8_MAGML
MRDSELDPRQAEPVMRAEPDMRTEPSLNRPMSGRYADEMEPDMGSLHRAVSEIAETSINQPQQPAPHAEPHRAGSLLNRLVNRGRHAISPASAPAPRAPEAPAPRMEARREPTAPRSGEDLDIPAFLRRQAN